MLDAMLEQQTRNGRRRVERGWWIVSDRPPVGVRVRVDRWQSVRHTALRRGNAGKIVTGARDHRVIHGVDGVQCVQGKLYILRLTGRAALIGFQRVAKAPVLVLVRAQCREHRLRAAIGKQRGKQVTLDQPGITPGEILRFLKSLLPVHEGFLSPSSLLLQQSMSHYFALSVVSSHGSRSSIMNFKEII